MNVTWAWGCLLFLACSQAGAVTSGEVGSETRRERLQALEEILKKRDENDRKQVPGLARRMGIPVRRELPNGRILELQRLVPGQGPVFYITNNIDAADTLSTDEVWPGGSTGLSLEGIGMTVGEWDAGAVLGDHPDLFPRVDQVDGTTSVSNHSTHVAGTLIGSGAHVDHPEAKGMAYGAYLDAYDWNSDTAEMAAAAADGLLLSNHSYGIAAGWIYIGGSAPDTWWWIGGEDNSEDPNFGYYDTESQYWDQIAYDAPSYLIVKAAGNDRADIGPTPGESYTIVDQTGAYLSESTDPRPADCAPSGYDCLPTTSVAKNILTVGAVDDLPGGYSPLTGPSAVQMADFSSWGPTDDGRIKPDLVGNGVLLSSTYGEYPYWATALGTSMSAPNVTGSLLLLQEHYENVNGYGNFMRGATLKALAIHTADEAGDADGPDYGFGWGLLNTKAAAQAITDDRGDHHIIEGSLSNGATDNVQIDVDMEDAVIKATLVWADPPGTPVAPTLDPPDLMLVNDLDLRIREDAFTYLPWVLDPADPAAPAARGDNVRDNVEQVFIVNAATGSYVIEVSHKGVLDGGTQDYSLIVSVESRPPSESGLLIDEDFSGGLPSGWTVDTVRGASWTVNTPVPGDSILDNRTGGSGKFAIVNNDFRNTVTSLRTPVLNLSAAEAVVLRFKSFFVFELWETINVDVSTDGGIGWRNVWQWAGFNPFAAQYGLDLTAETAGHTNVMLRFRYDTDNWSIGDFWQVDDVQLEVFGGVSPENNPPTAVGDEYSIGEDATLTVAAPGVLDNDTDTDGDALAAIPASDPASGTLTLSPDGGFVYTPNPDFNGTDSFTYRANDGAAVSNTATVSITVTPVADLPGPASNPIPADGAVGLSPETTLAWSAGSFATSHDVYFGTDAELDGGDFQGNQGGTTFDPGTLAYETTYRWRVDEVNGDGTTTGTTWNFTTAAAPTLETMHLAQLSAAAIPGARGRWTARVTIHVEDQADGPEDAVTVEGVWSGGTKGDATCVTGADGSCTVEKSNLKSDVVSVTFSVTNLTKTGVTYQPDANLGSASITITPGGGDLLPVAVGDSYQTPVDTPVAGNLMENDDPGDGPAIINAHAAPASGTLDLASDGLFTYTPATGFTGADNFSYSIVDQDGDVSNTARVDIEVTGNEPPPASNEPGVTATPYKVKGLQHVELNWENFSGDSVDIYRDDNLIAVSADNTGLYDDDIGAKGGGQTYVYEVCEAGHTDVCARDTATF